MGLRLCGTNLFHSLKHIFQEEIIAQIKNQVSLLHEVEKHVIVNHYFQVVEETHVGKLFMPNGVKYFHDPLTENTDQISLEMDWRLFGVM